MTYFAEQGFSQVVHIRSEYRNHLDMNKTGGNAIRLKLTNLQIALKNLQINTIIRFALFRTRCFLEMNNIYSTNAFAFVLFSAN